MSKVLYFSAEWCNPCKAMKPIIEKFEEDHSDVQIIRIDADDQLELVKNHSVQSIPTFILINENEEEVKRHRGAMNELTFNTFIYGE
jgi:thioredoxin 1